MQNGIAPVWTRVYPWLMALPLISQATVAGMSGDLWSWVAPRAQAVFTVGQPLNVESSQREPGIVVSLVQQ